SINHTGPTQESFAFQRPRVGDAPLPVRSHYKKGRIRGFLKKSFVVISMVGMVGLVFAYSQGLTDTWASAAWDKALAISVNSGFALESIKAEGQEKTPEGAILEVLGITEGDALFGMDMTALSARVEALPWVSRAVVSRELPATIKVYVVEREPFARWQINGELVLVDETAAVIRGAKTADYAHLPFVVGPGAPEAASALFNLLATTPELSKKVVAAVRVGQRRWDLEFDNGMRLKLPEQGDTYGEAEAWAAFINLTEEKDLMALDVAEADLRLPDRIIMRLTPEGQKAFENNDQGT
ncbi:MAG: cell division protein FtsQ/DivIB, partial [Sphingomonadales bacterium]